MFTVLIFGRNTQYLHMAKDLYDWQAKGFSEIYEHTRESAAISAISAKAARSARRGCTGTMYGADGVFAPGSVAGAADARDPAHVAEGFFRRTGCV